MGMGLRIGARPPLAAAAPDRDCPDKVYGAVLRAIRWHNSSTMTRRAAVAVLAASALLAGVAAASNDRYFDEQWGLHRIEGPAAWAAGNSGAGITVAVVDTGVDFAHEDLAGHSAGSFDCMGPSCVPGGADNTGHGTEVAGVVAATAGNGKGIAGTAPSASIVSVKVLDGPLGSGSSADVIRGINYAAGLGNVSIINLSLGELLGILSDQHFHAAVAGAHNAGKLVVASACNDTGNPTSFNRATALVVGASDNADRRASYSSTGYEVLAPGGDALLFCDPAKCIRTTSSGGGYTSVAGTSFAAPFVSGQAALLMAAGYRNVAQVEDIIIKTSDPAPDGPRINARKALGTPLPPAAPAGQATNSMQPAAPTPADEVPPASGSASRISATQAPASSRQNPAAAGKTKPGGAADATRAADTPPVAPGGPVAHGAGQGSPLELGAGRPGSAEGSGLQAGAGESNPPSPSSKRGSALLPAAIALLVLSSAAGGWIYFRRPAWLPLRRAAGRGIEIHPWRR